jgi:hypothetical protein
MENQEFNLPKLPEEIHVNMEELPKTPAEGAPQEGDDTLPPAPKEEPPLVY